MTGRPSVYTAEIAAEICVRLACGESLRAICHDETMPGQMTIYRWLSENCGGFREQYARARAIARDIAGMPPWLAHATRCFGVLWADNDRCDRHRPGFRLTGTAAHTRAVSPPLTWEKPFTTCERSLRFIASEVDNPGEIEFARRTPAMGTGRNSRPKRLIQGKATPVQLLRR
jgi:hypothetical protein